MNFQHLASHPQTVNGREEEHISAWVKCPSCSGVLGVPLGKSQGPCVFCQQTIRVHTAVQAVMHPSQQADDLHDDTAQPPIRLNSPIQSHSRRMDGH